MKRSLVGIFSGDQQGIGTEISITLTFSVDRWLCGSDKIPPRAESVKVQASA
jgi:hypothetical protein